MKQKKRLRQSALLEIFEKLYAYDDRPYFGHIMDSDMPDYINQLKEEGYFDTLPESEKNKFKSFLNRVYSEEKDIVWNVNKKNRIVESFDKLEQLLLFSGFYASYILSPEEIWNFKKFGFSSVSELVGTVGAKMLHHQGLPLFGNGLTWTSENEGRILESEISGDTHAD